MFIENNFQYCTFKNRKEYSMLGTFIYNSSDPNNRPNSKRRNIPIKEKKQSRNTENYDLNQVAQALPKNNQNQEKAIFEKQKNISNAQSSCSLENDLCEIPQYASGVANSKSSLNSRRCMKSNNNELNSNESSDFSMELICVENAKLKTQLEEMGEKEDSMKLLAEENEKLRHAHLKMNFELEKLKALKTITPQYQNYTLTQQIQELKEENKNKSKLISQLGKQQNILSEENEKLKAQISVEKERFNQLSIDSKSLLSENERLQQLFQEQKRKSHLKKEEIQTLKLKIEQNGLPIDHQAIKALNDQVEKLEKSFSDIQGKNDRLAKENAKLKEQISLYQQIDSKMQIENQQLKSTIKELLSKNESSKQLSTIVNQDKFDESQYVSKAEAIKLNSSISDYQQKIDDLQNNFNQTEKQLSLKDLQLQELLKEKENLLNQLNRSKQQIEEIKKLNEKFESQYNSSQGEIDRLKKVIIANEQISYENSQLRERNLSLSQKLAEYSSHEKLELENNSLKQENIKLKEALDQASQISEIKDIVYENGYGYGKDANILTNENEELKNELEDAKNRLNSIMNVLKKCSAEKIIPEF